MTAAEFAASEVGKAFEALFVSGETVRWDELLWGEG